MLARAPSVLLLARKTDEKLVQTYLESVCAWGFLKLYFCGSRASLTTSKLSKLFVKKNTMHVLSADIL